MLAPIGMGQHQVGFERDGAVEACNAFVELAQKRQRRAPIVVRGGQIGIEQERAFMAFQRFFQPIHRRQRAAAIIVRRGGIGIEGKRPILALERLLVTAVEAQPDAKIKMSDSEVPVELDRAVRVRNRGPDISSPMACLGEHILGLRVFTIESQSLKGGFACLTHEWSEVLYRPVIPLHDQRAGKSKMGVRTKLNSQSVGVKIVAANAYGIAAMNRGRLRHPVFGNTDVWVTQAVEPGWFDEPLQDSAPDIRRAITQALDTEARKLTIRGM